MLKTRQTSFGDSVKTELAEFGEAPMRHYRVYHLDDKGHIAAPPEIIEGADDKEAAEKAQQFIDDRAIELWDGDRLVTTMELKKAGRI